MTRRMKFIFSCHVSVLSWLQTEFFSTPFSLPHAPNFGAFDLTALYIYIYTRKNKQQNFPSTWVIYKYILSWTIIISPWANWKDSLYTKIKAQGKKQKTSKQTNKKNRLYWSQSICKRKHISQTVPKIISLVGCPAAQWLLRLLIY